MRWANLTVRLPVDLLEVLEKGLEKANIGQSVSLTLNEYVVEILRLNQVAIGGADSGSPLLGGDAGNETEPETRLTLHAAVEQVLREKQQPMKFADIRDEIVSRDLYREGDGSPPSHQQVRARISHYAHIFTVDRSKDPQEVGLRVWESNGR